MNKISIDWTMKLTEPNDVYSMLYDNRYYRTDRRSKQLEWHRKLNERNRNRKRCESMEKRPVDASLKNSDMIASIPKIENEKILLDEWKTYFRRFWPIKARITVNRGAAGKTTDALCSIIRKRSTEEKENHSMIIDHHEMEREFLLTDEKKDLKMRITKKHWNAHCLKQERQSRFIEAIFCWKECLMTYKYHHDTQSDGISPPSTWLCGTDETKVIVG